MENEKKQVERRKLPRRTFLQYSIAFGGICFSIYLFGLGFQTAWGAEGKYPNKAITIINPAAPGGTADIQSRGIAPYLQKALGVPVVVESVEGGGGIVGYTKVFNSKPDGYTIMFWPHTRAGMVEYLEKVPYKTAEFTPIFLMAGNPIGLVVNPKNYQSLPQFLEIAKSKTMSIGTSGHGSVAHLDGILISETLKFNAKYVPFGGGGESLNALIGGHVDSVVTSVGSSLGLVNSGVLKILFIIGKKREPLYPDFPASAELGYNIPIIHFAHGFAGPPKLPQNIVKTLEEGFFKAKEDPGFQTFVKKSKIDFLGQGAEEYKKIVQEEVQLLKQYVPKFGKMM